MIRINKKAKPSGHRLQEMYFIYKDTDADRLN